MIEKTQLQNIIESWGVCILIIVALTFWMLSSGMITITPDEPAAPVPEPISTVTIITAEPTPTSEQIQESLPAVAEYVDPYAPGSRSEKQWYNWYRPNVQGNKSMNVGVVAYRHTFLDRYTWWNPSTANYFTETPEKGNRFLAVWVHEEMFGTNQSDDPSLWAIDDQHFAVQIGNQMYYSLAGVSYNPVLRIKEFDYMYDYYHVINAPPFGYYVRYTGNNPESGGFLAEKVSFLRMGQGNAIDGYILFEVPKETLTKDIYLNGNFDTFGDAQWKLI